MDLIRENRYIGGEMLDVDIFAVKKRAKTRACRAKPTSETQARLNRKNSEKRLRRLLHLNFIAGRDREITLTFDDAKMPATDDGQERAVKNYLRRLKRIYDKQGAEFRYIVCMGGRDGRARRHVHITVSGSDKIPRSALESAWKNGTCNTDLLQDADGKMFAPLAGYITSAKQLDRTASGAGGKKRWWGSRNLKKPKAAERTGYLSKKTVRGLIYGSELDTAAVEEIYRGYRVVDFDISESPLFGEVYINILLRRISTEEGEETDCREKRNTQDDRRRNI